ncbi:hypothetical protein QQ045_008512 [Rhodiola kirilowii]
MDIGRSCSGRIFFLESGDKDNENENIKRSIMIHHRVNNLPEIHIIEKNVEVHKKWNKHALSWKTRKRLTRQRFCFGNTEAWRNP